MRKEIMFFRKKISKEYEETIDDLKSWKKGIALGKDGETTYVAIEEEVNYPKIRHYPSSEIETKPYNDETVDMIITQIKEKTLKEIKALEETYLSENRKDYSEEIEKKYLRIKKDIINTCKNVNESLSEVDLHNKLSEISRKRKQMFEIKCDDVRKAQKQNASIRGKIARLKREEENAIRIISSKPSKVLEVLKIKRPIDPRIV